MPTTKPVNVSTETFETEVLQAKGPVILDFWAPWCGPCRLIGPALDEIASEYAGRVKVVKINVDEEPELARAFHIRTIPTLVAMMDGAILDQQTGWSGKRHLQQAVEKLSTMNQAGAA